MFIGTDYNKEEIMKELDKALLTDEEMKVSPQEWNTTFTDPFPKWDIPEESEEEAEKRFQEELEAIQEEKEKILG